MVMNVDRPCIVLDCSGIREMDRVTIHMLLCCLEEAIKRNGDVKLSAVNRTVRETLVIMGVNRLFEIYDTETDAVDSFFQTRLEGTPNAREVYSPGISESAA